MLKRLPSSNAIQWLQGSKIDNQSFLQHAASFSQVSVFLNFLAKLHHYVTLLQTDIDWDVFGYSDFISIGELIRTKKHHFAFQIIIVFIFLCNETNIQTSFVNFLIQFQIVFEKKKVIFITEIPSDFVDFRIYGFPLINS